MGSLCGLLLDTVFFAATASATAALRWADFRAATDTGPPFNEEGGGSGTEKLEKAAETLSATPTHTLACATIAWTAIVCPHCLQGNRCTLLAKVAVVVDAAALLVVVLVVDPLLALRGVLVRLRGVAVALLSSVRSFDSGLPSSSSSS